MSAADVAVLGGGAWGKALALAVARTGRAVTLWNRSPRATRADDPTDPSIATTTDAAAVARCGTVVLAVPAQAVRTVVATVPLSPSARLVIAAKGLEQASGKFLSQVIAEESPSARVFVLSGPSFADDVIRALPVAVALAGPTVDDAQALAPVFASPTFRIYPTDDIVGVQAGGALKNVLAIACGIADGKHLGGSARAALITRSFAELSRLATAMGARAETVFGLSGLGDLVLTATGGLSRNYALGLRLGEGYSLADAVARIEGVSEGRYTAAAAAALARRHGVEAPIIAAVDAVIAGRSSPETEIDRLLSRPMRQEF